MSRVRGCTLSDHVEAAEEHIQVAQQTNGFTGMMHAGVAQAHAILALVEVLSPKDERPTPTVFCRGCGKGIIPGTATVRPPERGVWHPQCWDEAQP